MGFQYSAWHKMSSDLCSMQSAAYAGLFKAISMPQKKISALVESQTDAFAAWTDIDWLVKNLHDQSFDLEFASYVDSK